MKKLLALITALLLMMTVSCADTALPEIPVFAEATGLNEFLALITEDNPVVSVSFSQGYGFSGGDYTTENPEEIQALLNAVAQIEIESASSMSVTDWYPYICFVCADHTAWGLHFEARWLYLGGQNYNLANADSFWTLFAKLEKIHDQAQ